MPLHTLALEFLPPGSKVLSISALGQGNINDTYAVACEGQQDIVLQRLNHLIFTEPEAVMHNIETVCRFLNTQNTAIYTPAPLLTNAGQNLLRDPDGNYWRAFPMIGNIYTPDAVKNADEAFEIARGYGLFSRALFNFPATELRETLPGFHDTLKRWNAYQQILQADPVGRRAECIAETEAIAAMLPIFEKIHALKQSGALPLRVTHNDTKSGNVLLDKDSGKAVAIIDLDTLMPGVLLSDFGDLVRTAASNQYEDDPDTEAMQIRVDILENLRAGFLESLQDVLRETERQYLNTGALWIVGEQALRFFSDHLAGDRYYKIKYPGHNLVRARNQIRLFQLLQDHLNGF